MKLPTARFRRETKYALHFVRQNTLFKLGYGHLLRLVGFLQLGRVEDCTST